MNIQTTASTGEGPDHTRPLVLVVDGEEPLRRALERHLDKLGYDVIATGDGDHATERAASAQAGARALAAALRQAFPIHTAGLETLANRIWRFSVARAIAMQV